MARFDETVDLLRELVAVLEGAIEAASDPDERDALKAIEARIKHINATVRASIELVVPDEAVGALLTDLREVVTHLRDRPDEPGAGAAAAEATNRA